MNPLLILGALGVGAYLVMSKSGSSSSSSAPITSVPLGFDNAGNPTSAVGSRVGANLAPNARHVYAQRGPLLPGWGGGGVTVTPPAPPAIPGVFFDTTIWAWLAYGATAPASAPQPGGGSWVLVTSLGPDAAAALYPDSGSGVLYSPFALPVWVWYPPAGGLYGIGTSGDTSSWDEMPAMWSGTEWTWAWKPGADIPVFNSPSPPPAGGYPGSDSWIEVFPNYWVLGVLLAAEKAAAPTPPVSLTPPAPSASIRRHAPRPARFDPMSGRTY